MQMAQILMRIKERSVGLLLDNTHRDRRAVVGDALQMDEQLQHQRTCLGIVVLVLQALDVT